jgi:hypothetical protein
VDRLLAHFVELFVNLGAGLEGARFAIFRVLLVGCLRAFGVGFARCCSNVTLASLSEPDSSCYDPLMPTNDADDSGFCRGTLPSRRCLAPKGRPEISPGREPGVRPQNSRALKGRHKSQVAQGFCAAPSGFDVCVMKTPRAHARGYFLSALRVSETASGELRDRNESTLPARSVLESDRRRNHPHSIASKARTLILSQRPSQRRWVALAGVKSADQ